MDTITEGFLQAFKLILHLNPDLIGIIVLFFYWNVILFSRVLGETGGLSPVIAGWSEVIIFSALGALLMWKCE